MNRLARLGVRKWPLTGMILSLALSAGGCLSPIALHKAVMEYDRSTAQIEAELLLLNIARAQLIQPLHFTAVTSVTATFDFSTTAGIEFQSISEDALTQSYSVTVTESPTITIIPIDGEEFTMRLLAPIGYEKVAFLASQGVEPGLFMRLLGERLLVREDYGTRVLHNNPVRNTQYTEFRKRVLHLSSLLVHDQLYLEYLHSEKKLPFTIHTDASEKDVVENLGLSEIIEAEEMGYRWRDSGRRGVRVLSKHIEGRPMLANYHLNELSNDERLRLLDEAGSQPDNTILVDIRPGKPGGNYPLRGYFWLRSFAETLQFVARINSTTPEFDVQPDPRTEFDGQNPQLALKIEKSTTEPTDATFKVEHDGFWYWIKNGSDVPQGNELWNLEAFRTLNQLYQMTVIGTDLDEREAPDIAITK